MKALLKLLSMIAMRSRLRLKTGDRRATVAIVISALALAASVGGPAVAAGVKHLIGAGEIKRNAVRSKHVKDGSLEARDFKPGVLLAGSRGPQGPTGSGGSAGPTGPAGPRGEWPGEATPFTIPMTSRPRSPFAALGAFKLVAGCHTGGAFVQGYTWEGEEGPASVELFQTRRSRELTSAEQVDFDTYNTINNGIGGNSGVIDGLFRWDFEARSSTGAISGTVWLYGDGVDKCQVAARGWIEGDATFLG